MVQFESITAWAAREGRRFEVVAFAEYRASRHADPIAPISLAHLPKSVVNELFSQEASVETLSRAQEDSGTSVTKAGAHKGKDYVTFVASTCPTRLEAPCGTFVTAVLTDAKTNPADHRQLLSVENEHLKWKECNDWGSVPKHFIIVVPERVTQANQPALACYDTHLNHVVANSNKFWHKDKSEECVTVGIPFQFGAPRAIITSGEVTDDQIRPWVHDTVARVKDIMQSTTSQVILVDAACGSGKTSFMHTLGSKSIGFQLVINLFPLIDLADQMVKRHECTPIHSHNGMHVRDRLAGLLKDSESEKKIAAMCISAFDDATIASFNKWLASKLRLQVLFVVDEVHKLRCEEKIECLLQHRNVCMVCVSATIPTKWSFGPALNETFAKAPYVHGMTFIESIRQGYTMAPVFRMIRAEDGQNRIESLVTYAMVESEARNILVICASKDEAVDFAKCFYDHSSAYGCCVIKVSAKREDLCKIARDKYSSANFLDGVHMKNTTETFRAACLRAFGEEWNGKKNIMISILTCVVGADYPGVDHVVCTRPLGDNIYRHCSPGQLLYQYMRQTRVDVDHNKKIAEMSLLYTDTNCEAVAQFLTLYDPGEHFCAVYVWEHGKSAREQLVSAVDPKADAQLHGLKTRAQQERVKSLHKTFKTHHYDDIAKAFVESHAGVAKISPKTGIQFAVTVQGRTVDFQSNDVVKELLERFRDESLGPDAMMELRSHPGFVLYHEKPELESPGSLPDKKPAGYDDMLMSIQHVTSPFVNVDVIAFINATSSIDEKVKGCTLEIMAILCGPGPFVYTYKVKPHRVKALQELCAGNPYVSVYWDDTDKKYKCAVDMYPEHTTLRQCDDVFILKAQMDKYISGNDTGNGGMSLALGKLYFWQLRIANRMTVEEVASREELVRKKRKEKEVWDKKLAALEKKQRTGHQGAGSVPGPMDAWLKASE